jgi:hypothetical protein
MDDYHLDLLFKMKNENNKYIFFLRALGNIDNNDNENDNDNNNVLEKELLEKDLEKDLNKIYNKLKLFILLN